MLPAELVTRGQVVLLSDIPGTAEVPEFVGQIVRQAVVAEVPVVVGLELPMSEPLDGSLGSFWSRSPEFVDGRSSQAMADLVAELVALSADGVSASVRVVATDGPWVAPGSAVPLDQLNLLEQPRDETMASNFLDAIDSFGSSRCFALALAGPMHTRLLSPNERPTFGSLVRRWHRHTISLQTLCTGGELWVLDPSSTTSRGGGGVVTIRASESDHGPLENPVEYASDLGVDGFHGVVNVGRVTASLPAEIGL